MVLPINEHCVPVSDQGWKTVPGYLPWSRAHSQRLLLYLKEMALCLLFLSLWVTKNPRSCFDPLLIQHTHRNSWATWLSHSLNKYTFWNPNVGLYPCLLFQSSILLFVMLDSISHANSNFSQLVQAKQQQLHLGITSNKTAIKDPSCWNVLWVLFNQMRFYKKTLSNTCF